MKSKIYLPVLILLTFFSLFAQSEKGKMFAGTEDLLKQAKNVDAEFLSPSIFKKGMDFYNKAKLDLKEGKDVAVVYDELQFLKVDDVYKAGYEMTAIILDGKDQADGDIWKEDNGWFEFGKVLNRYVNDSKEVAKMLFKNESATYKIEFLKTTFKYIANKEYIKMDDDLIKNKKKILSSNNQDTLDNLVLNFEQKIDLPELTKLQQSKFQVWQFLLFLP